MAESADVLRQPHQTVVLPDMKAGCSMADMASIEDVEEAWDRLVKAHGDVFTPVTYMNSTAALKAFCGARGGVVCTSSNAAQVLEWAWRASRVLLPGPAPRAQHVVLDGRAARADGRVGLAREDLSGANTRAFDPATRIVLWKALLGAHEVRQSQIDEVRAADPAVKVLVHPETPFEVVRNADLVGSTEFIIEQVRAAAPGTHWAIGTEINRAPAGASSIRSRTSTRCRRTSARAPR